MLGLGLGRQCSRNVAEAWNCKFVSEALEKLVRIDNVGVYSSVCIGY
jgi:hypothetical protein